MLDRKYDFVTYDNEKDLIKTNKRFVKIANTDS